MQLLQQPARRSAARERCERCGGRRGEACAAALAFLERVRALLLLAPPGAAKATSADMAAQWATVEAAFDPAAVLPAFAAAATRHGDRGAATLARACAALAAAAVAAGLGGGGALPDPPRLLRAVAARVGGAGAADACARALVAALRVAPPPPLPRAPSGGGAGSAGGGAGARWCSELVGWLAARDS